jgi:hypothetical protein
MQLFYRNSGNVVGDLAAKLRTGGVRQPELHRAEAVRRGVARPLCYAMLAKNDVAAMWNKFLVRENKSFSERSIERFGR